MDSYLGNEQLLDQTLVAFFASRGTPDDVAQRALRWAEMICHTDKVVISGFHSPLEKEVLNVLLEHKHPVILALGRSVYKRVPQQFEQPLAEGRMLIVSICNTVSHGCGHPNTAIGQSLIGQMSASGQAFIGAVHWMFPLTYICQKVRK